MSDTEVRLRASFEAVAADVTPVDLLAGVTRRRRERGHRRRGIAAGVLALVVVAGGVGAGVAVHGPGARTAPVAAGLGPTRTVSYRGVTVQAPAAWRSAVAAPCDGRDTVSVGPRLVPATACDVAPLRSPDAGSVWLTDEPGSVPSIAEPASGRTTREIGGVSVLVGGLWRFGDPATGLESSRRFEVPSLGVAGTVSADDPALVDRVLATLTVDPDVRPVRVGALTVDVPTSWATSTSGCRAAVDMPTVFTADPAANCDASGYQPLTQVAFLSRAASVAEVTAQVGAAVASTISGVAATVATGTSDGDSILGGDRFAQVTWLIRFPGLPQAIEVAVPARQRPVGAAIVASVRVAVASP